MAKPTHAHQRSHIHEHQNTGERIADTVTSFAGSIPFILLHAIWFFFWISLHVEPFPFALLTMIVSLEAIFLSSVVLLSQQRSATRDKRRDDQEAKEVHVMSEVNQKQLTILEKQNIMLEKLDRVQGGLDEHLRSTLPLKSDTT